MTTQLESFRAHRRSSMCTHQPRIGAPRLPAGVPSESSHAAAVPPSGHSRNYGRRLPRFPRWFGRTSPAPPPIQSCSPGRGELLPCCSARKGGARGGAAAALGCDPGGFTSGSRFAGAGRGGLGWGGQGRYLRAGGVWRSGPLGVTRPTPSGAYLPLLGSIPLSPDLLRVRSGHHPVEAADPREAPGGVGGRRGEL